MLLAALVQLLAPPGPARAAGPYDPALSYRTVSSRRFAVHYPEGGYNLAVRVARLAERIVVADAELLRNMPRGTIDIVLTDSQDEANGSAQVVPKNILRLYLAAPTELTGLSFYDDWLTILLTHELAHLVDIDHTAGFTRALRAVLGNTVAYNGSTPQFLSEGVAVYTETKLTTTGRGRSSYVEMLLRNAALAGTFPHIDQAHILYAEYPYGNAAYFFGGRFHLYLSERFGPDAVARLHAYYAAQLLPLFYDPGAHAILGHSLPHLWADFRASERDYALEVAANVAASGETQTTALTRHGRDLTGARYSPLGTHVVYSRRSPYDGPTVRLLRAADGSEQALALDTFSHRFAFDRDGAHILYSQAAIDHRFDNFGELYAFDLREGERHRLATPTPHLPLRARDPALSPDGTMLYFVQTELQQSWLARAPLLRDAQGRPRGLGEVARVLPPSGDMQVASPAPSPDGRLVAVAVWLPGGLRDIVVLDARTGALERRITCDAAQEGNPAWSPDGAHLLYESDADGISNIYAYTWATGAYSRVTNVVGGAFQPDVRPDGQAVLLRFATGVGFDLHEMRFDPASWAPQHYAPATGYTAAQTPAPAAAPTAAAGFWAAAPAAGAGPQVPGPGQPPRSEAPSPSQPAAGAIDIPAWAMAPLPAPLSRAEEPPLALHPEDHEHEGPYRPSRTLVPGPNNWLIVPGLLFLNNDPGFVLSSFGQDPLGRHTWAASAGSSMHARTPNISLAYANDRLLPTLGLSLQHAGTAYDTAGGWAVERDATASAYATWPLRNRHRLSLGYTFEHRRGNPLAQELLRLGRVASLQLSYSYRFARNFTYSISPEHGRQASLGALWFSRALGSAYEEVLLTADVRGYLNNPLVANHVLALRLTINYALGPDRVQSFFLYGTQGSSFLTVQSSRLFGLRGFQPYRAPFGAPPSGTGLVAGYGEYRLPLWHIQRGLWDLPIYFEHVHLALFADVGSTFGTLRLGANRELQASLSWALQHLWLGTGAEVRLDVALAWSYLITLRGGIAQPTLAAGTRVFDTARPLVYFNVGTTL